MRARITSTGIAGFHIALRSVDIYIDSFYAAPQGRELADRVGKADIVLATHSHWDHFDARATAEVISRTGAMMAGPRPVIKRMRRSVPEHCLLELEPSGSGKEGPSIDVRGIRITAFRTNHSNHHNSYLVETSDFRFFHDGDNEDTGILDTSRLGTLDALLIGPWQGSGWVEFIERLNPTRYFLSHLTDEELDEHEAGRFLPDICDRVPPGLVVLRPGESFAM